MTTYYPMVKQSEHSDVNALCESNQLNFELIARYIANAEIEGSPLVVCDRLVLGDPANKMCAVLQLQHGGAVTLWAGLFGEASADREQVASFIKETRDTFGRDMAIGEFTKRTQGHA